MTGMARRVAEWHDDFGVSEDAALHPADVTSRRIALHDEEHFELIRALRERLLVDKPFIESTDDRDPQVEVAGRGRIKVVRVAVDERKIAEHIARELADVLVVAFGTADLLGIDLEAAFDAVMTANEAKLPECPECYGPGAVREVDLRGMSELQAYLAIQDAQAAANPTCSYCHGTGKGKPIKRDDGKVMKPEDWQPPDMSGALR